MKNDEEKAGGAVDADPAKVELSLYPLVKTLLGQKYYISGTKLLSLALVMLTVGGSGTAFLGKVIQGKNDPETIAQITTPVPDKSVPWESKLKGIVRNLPMDEMLYVEMQNESHQLFYRPVAVRNDEFWKDDLHLGKVDADFGKRFRVQMFAAHRDIPISREVQTTRPPGRYVGEPVYYVRRTSNQDLASRY